MLESWAEQDDKDGDASAAEANRAAAVCIRALKIPGALMDCMCPGCPNPLLAISRSGLCEDCANLDCEHDEPEASRAT